MATWPSPLTLETLIIQLEKSRKSTTAELTASSNAARAPINSALESIATTVAKHTSTISEMGTALSTHSDNITSLGQDVVELRSKLTLITEEKGALQAAVEDLVSRSKRQNLRVIGLPEDIEACAVVLPPMMPYGYVNEPSAFSTFKEVVLHRDSLFFLIVVILIRFVIVCLLLIVTMTSVAEDFNC
ncbi:hypothetical protein JOB18_015988 [Solea senegalensis]|uniref:Uncharacterized protein n=1 Tax=Solea senegalensis TaxID=28829 RepID=A0AAV6PPX4_SOLSE|nr:hypothetical protein JOB18_015988 [Solea senegalensis]